MSFYIVFVLFLFALLARQHTEYEKLQLVHFSCLLEFAPLSMSEVELIIVVTPLQTLFSNVGKGSPRET